jgi:hypothetical protein
MILAPRADKSGCVGFVAILSAKYYSMQQGVRITAFALAVKVCVRCTFIANPRRGSRQCSILLYNLLLMLVSDIYMMYLECAIIKTVLLLLFGV